jgi:hypothetical protein
MYEVQSLGFPVTDGALLREAKLTLNLVLLALAKALSMDTFVDVFAASHKNSRIGLQLF